jgi:hypothetical protein
VLYSLEVQGRNKDPTKVVERSELSEVLVSTVWRPQAVQTDIRSRVKLIG